jgi:hypothetical protein
MNRLSPLIVRRTGRFAPELLLSLPLSSIAVPAPSAADLRTFATTFLGGFVFFSAFLA